MHGLCHGRLLFVLIQTNGDGNCQALKVIDLNSVDERNFVVEFIDPCLTSICQSPELAVSGLLKKMIREEYHNHVAELFSTLNQSANVKAEDKIPVYRGDLVRFIKHAYGKINFTKEKIVGFVNI